MNDLISREALLRELAKGTIITDDIYGMGIMTGISHAQDVTKNLHAVDAVQVVHGWWEWYADRCEDLFLGCDEDYGWRCNHCKTPLEDCDDPEAPPAFNYCHECGAKMDLEVVL